MFESLIINSIWKRINQRSKQMINRKALEVYNDDRKREYVFDLKLFDPHHHRFFCNMAIRYHEKSGTYVYVSDRKSRQWKCVPLIYPQLNRQELIMYAQLQLPPGGSHSLCNNIVPTHSLGILFADNPVYTSVELVRCKYSNSVIYVSAIRPRKRIVCYINGLHVRS